MFQIFESVLLQGPECSVISGTFKVVGLFLRLGFLVHVAGLGC